MNRPTVFSLVGPFAVGGLLLAAVTFIGVPALVARAVTPLVALMLLAPPCVFLPLAGWGWWSLRRERSPRPLAGLASSDERALGDLAARLWLQKPTRQDWLAGIGGIVAIVLLTGPLALLAGKLGLAIHPPGIPPPPALTRETFWVVGVWLVYWPINMLGEELVWRGVLLPRMEARFGARAWLLNAASWFLFHLSFGPGNILVLIPTLAIVPLIVQRRRNVWLGVLLHATPSLPGFIAMAFGAA